VHGLLRFISKLSDKFIESFIRKNKDDVEDSIKKITDSNITNHDIFTYIDFWRYSKFQPFSSQQSIEHWYLGNI
jgi:hypothetical protein